MADRRPRPHDTTAIERRFNGRCDAPVPQRRTVTLMRLSLANSAYDDSAQSKGLLILCYHALREPAPGACAQVELAERPLRRRAGPVTPATFQYGHNERSRTTVASPLHASPSPYTTPHVPPLGSHQRRSRLLALDKPASHAFPRRPLFERGNTGATGA